MNYGSTSVPPEAYGQPECAPVVARALQRAQSRFGAHAAVFETVAARLRERLDLVAASPRRVLDLGCRNGYQLEALSEQFPEAEIVGVDPTDAPHRTAAGGGLRQWWRQWRSGGRRIERVQASLDDLPFCDADFDLVVSNLALTWCESPARIFAEASRVLVDQGAFFFSAAGPDTLQEYRAVWANVDAYPHTFGLVDMHDLGDAMLRAGFADPVMDRGDVTVDYPSLNALEEELRGMGAPNLARGRRRGLMAPILRERLTASVDKTARFPVTLELVQGHGWKVPPKPQQTSRGIEQSIPLEQVLDKLKR